MFGIGDDARVSRLFFVADLAGIGVRDSGLQCRAPIQVARPRVERSAVEVVVAWHLVSSV